MANPYESPRASEGTENADKKLKSFSPGFRFSSLDAVVLALGTVGVLLAPAVFTMHEPWKEITLAIGMPVLAFFAFCNVFRVSRPLELLWAAVFVALCVSSFRYRVLNLIAVAWSSVVAMAAVVLLEMRRPSYHGVGWRLINPRLPDWWQERSAAANDPDGRC